MESLVLSEGRGGGIKRGFKREMKELRIYFMNPAVNSAPQSPHLPVVSIKLFTSPESQLHSKVEKDLYSATALNKAKMSEALSKVVKKNNPDHNFSNHKLSFTAAAAAAAAKKRSPYFGKHSATSPTTTTTDRLQTKFKAASLLNSKPLASTLSLSEAVAQAAAADGFTRKLQNKDTVRMVGGERQSRPNPRDK